MPTPPANAAALGISLAKLSTLTRTSGVHWMQRFECARRLEKLTGVLKNRFAVLQTGLPQLQAWFTNALGFNVWHRRRRFTPAVSLPVMSPLRSSHHD
jgi:hypothetical protein